MSIGRVPGATGIQPSIVDAKGDLIVATAADSVDRLAVGSANQVLTVDSSTATGLKWAALPASGKVLQVVQAIDATETTTATTTWTDIGLSQAITPSAATSKILIIVNGQTYNQRVTSNAGGGLRILRDSTFVWGEDIANSPFAGSYIEAAGASKVTRAQFVSYSYLDSPNTTSSITYKVQSALNNTADSATFITSYNGNDFSMILMEIGA